MRNELNMYRNRPPPLPPTGLMKIKTLNKACRLSSTVINPGHSGMRFAASRMSLIPKLWIGGANIPLACAAMVAPPGIMPCTVRLLFGDQAGWLWQIPKPFDRSNHLFQEVALNKIG